MLGVDKNTSIEDIKTAFRVNTLKNNNDFEILENAYKSILADKETVSTITGDINKPILDNNLSNLMMQQPFVQPCMITPNMFKINQQSSKIENPFENVFSMLFGGGSDVSKNTDIEENIENIIHEIANKMFDLKGGLHKIHEIDEEREKIDPIIICKNINISIIDIYNNINIGELLEIDSLQYLNIFEYKFNEVNTYNVNVDGKKYVYKITINIEEDKYFKVINEKLYYILPISLCDALCGFSKDITHLNGKTYTIKNSTKIINPDSVIELKKMGFKDNEEINSLYIQFKIEFPIELSDDIKKELVNILNK